MGDVGGFNGAIIIFPSYLMSWYAARRFNSSIYEDMPIKKQRSSRKRGKEYQQDMSVLQKKLMNGQDAFGGNGLNTRDVKSLAVEAKKIRHP